MKKTKVNSLKAMNPLPERYVGIFQELVDTYIETGEAVGSRLLSKRSASSLSSASIRNIMADLEDMGFLYAPHTSSGRIPTETGLRFFVDELLETSNWTDCDTKEVFSDLMQVPPHRTQVLLEKATTLLSGLSKCAGIVSSPKTSPIVQSINFVPVNQDQLLIIIVSDAGQIENRLISTSVSISLSADQLQQLSNFLSARIAGHTLAEGLELIEKELIEHKNEFDQLSEEILKKGIEIWRNDDYSGSLILHGHAHLLDHIEEMEELKNIQNLFELIETKHTMLDLLHSAAQANSVQVFIGSENPYFQISGCSLVLSPYRGNSGRVLGAIGVIGPAHMKYRSIIPLVNYTSEILSKILRQSDLSKDK